MKKFFTLALVLVLAFSLAACAGAPKKEATVKIGLGVVATGEVKAEASPDADGKVQSNSTFVAVLLDESGKILNCKVDVAQTTMQFSEKGALQSISEVETRSKMELGPDYGMTKASAIGKEWNEQAEFFAKYAVGKTADEILGIELVEENGHQVAKNTPDLYAGSTIDISAFQQALKQAVDTAVVMQGGTGDSLGLGLESYVAAASDASADEQGKIQHDTTAVAVSYDANGTVTGSVTNAVQTKYTVTAEGVATATNPTVTAKRELGADYGMAKASAIGKEWNEQAAAFDAYAVGKKASEITGIALVEEDGHNIAKNTPDLYAGATIDLVDILAAFAKATA